MIRELPKKYPRTFCPADLKGDDFEKLKPLFEALQNREITSAEELDQWIVDSNELSAIIQETGALFFAQTACYTQDKEAEQKYMDFVEEVQAPLKPLYHQLSLKYLELRKTIDLPEDRYFLYHRSLENHFKLFALENIPLETKETRLTQRYSKVRGNMTALWEGEEKPLSQLDPLLQSSNRETREKAWRLIQERRYQDREEIDDIFDELFQLRIQMGKNAGFEDYRKYRFASLGRFEYTPEDCIGLHRAVEKVVIPYIKELDKLRKEALSVETLRPWDIEASPYGQVPGPFQGQKELMEGCLKAFGALDSEFHGMVKEMDTLGLLDLLNRKNKAPGGFQMSLQESRYPFIFMNAVGVVQDLKTVFHEFGHAFNYYLSREDPLIGYRHGPMEFSEVASMSMELLSLPYWKVYYREEDFVRAEFDYFAGILKKIPWFSLIDSFQQEIYQRPDHKREDRKEIWTSLSERFGGGARWEGLENYRAYLWQKQLHLFQYPFYYVEYSLARMGSFQIWLLALEDPEKALHNYKNALSLGGTRDLPGLYKAAGIDLVFTEDALAALMERVMKEVFKLEEKARKGN